jgi:hypothetical protein
LQCGSDILEMPNASIEHRKKELKNRTSFLKHQSFGCIMQNQTLLGFATLDRNEDKLALRKPQICLIISNNEHLRQVLLALRNGSIEFLLTQTPLFAYEPILERLQKKIDIELDHDLLAYSEKQLRSPVCPKKIVETLQTVGTHVDLQQLLGTAKQLSLDVSQIEALVTALTYQVASIQGPPGSHVPLDSKI